MSKRRALPKIVQSVNGTRLGDFAAGGSDNHTQWLWEGRIPLGKRTALEGDPEMGKSFITLDLAARVTYEREMPDATPGVFGGAVLLCAEVDIATTVMQRLDAADAALDLIYVLETVEGWNPNIGYGGGQDRWPVRLPSDLAALGAAIEHTEARLLVIILLVAFLDPSAGSGREQDMYEALGPLAQLVENTGVAMLLARHLTKNRSRVTRWTGALVRWASQGGCVPVCSPCVTTTTRNRAAARQHKEQHRAGHAHVALSCRCKRPERRLFLGTTNRHCNRRGLD